MIKGKFQDWSLGKKLGVLLFGHFLIGVLIALIVPSILGPVFGVESSDQQAYLNNASLLIESSEDLETDFIELVIQLAKETPQKLKNLSRWTQLVYSFVGFWLVALLYKRFFVKDQIGFFEIRRTRLRFYLFSALIVWFGVPLLQAANMLMEMSGIPDFLDSIGISAETSSYENLLTGYALIFPVSSSDLFQAVLLVGILPAIAEELFFRGAIQKTIGQKTNDPHKAILITAIIFALVHMDITGFLYRFVLGVILGYMYLWGRSIILPIITHATNNILTVAQFYMIQESGMDVNESVGTTISFSEQFFWSTPSVALILVVFYLDYKRHQDQKHILEP